MGGHKFKKYAVPAGINEPKKSCHGARKARAEVAAYADCTKSRATATSDPKMPAHYIAQANRVRLGISGMEKIVTFDRGQSLDGRLAVPQANSAQERSGPIPRRKLNYFNMKCELMVRSEGVRICCDFNGLS
ncbi:hypothetical protein [Bradyrhizobium tropiciagri]|uniref:hypothetical protein n=1 Tax=Bradyrhizobium tropiciagri TaxID=312253 RepID=UPI00067B607E|nr:hypothetical protein [Bradyrhizobium tropiciagri]